MAKDGSPDMNRVALSRAAMQSWRAELYLSALTSAAACKWHVLPPPNLRDPAAQELAVRRHLRVLAVMCSCFVPFDAWSRYCVRRRHVRVRETRTAAAEALRASRLRANLLDETIHRFNKQEATLRTLGHRVRLREAMVAWRTSARESTTLRHAPSRYLALCLRRWRRSACFRRSSRGWLSRHVRRRNFAAGLLALRAAAARRRWLMARTTHFGLARALAAWRSLRCARRQRLVRTCIIWRRRRTSQLLSALRSWHRFTLRRTRRSLVAHQDRALSAMLSLWTDSAREVVRVLRAIPAGNDEEAVNALCALGGGWAGGRGAVEIAISELRRYKRQLLDEREAVRAAKARGEGASERVGELFEMLRQQRAILEALTSTVARSEAEALCLQRAVHVADRQAATLAAHPTVGDDTAAEFGALAARLPHAGGGVASTARESIASSSSDGSEELQSAGELRIGGLSVDSPSTTPPPTPVPERRADDAWSARPIARPLIAQLVLDSETAMRADLAPAEVRLTQAEERLLALEHKLACAIELLRARSAGQVGSRGRGAAGLTRRL